MAIQPIDLQTLYGQLDKIGKTQVQQQQAAQAARDAEQATNRQEAEKRLKTVAETAAGGEEVVAVHDRDASAEREREPKKEKKKDESAESEPQEAKKEIIQDPALGKHIDISG